MHRKHTAKAATFMHQIKCLVDLSKCQIVCDVLIHLNFLQQSTIVIELLLSPNSLIQNNKLTKYYLVHVFVNEPRDLRAALEATKGSTFPDSAGYKLERASAYLLS
jgi:hypothetical protein